MSLRPMLFASPLQPLMTAAESRDLALVPKVVGWFQTHLKNPDAAALESVERETVRLLGGELKGQAESEDHVQIVSALAEILGLQSDVAMIADGDWKQGAWEDYFEGTRTFIDPATSLQFGHLAQRTRPVFGTSIETSWAYYGYLFHGEAVELLAGLNAAAAMRPEIASSSFVGGFHNELTGWLQQVLDRRSDVWLFAS